MTADSIEAQKKNQVYFPQTSLRQQMWHRTTWERHRGGPEADDSSKGEVKSQLASIRVYVRKSKQGRMKSLAVASLNDSGELWVIRVVPSCLIPGPAMMKAEEYCLLGRTASWRRCGPG